MYFFPTQMSLNFRTATTVWVGFFFCRFSVTVEPTMSKKTLINPKNLKEKKVWMTSMKPNSLLLLIWREDTPFFWSGAVLGMSLPAFLKSSLRIKNSTPPQKKTPPNHAWKHDNSKHNLIIRWLTWFWRSDLCCLPSSSWLSSLLFHQDFRLQKRPEERSKNGSKHLPSCSAFKHSGSDAPQISDPSLSVAPRIFFVFFYRLQCLAN